MFDDKDTITEKDCSGEYGSLSEEEKEKLKKKRAALNYFTAAYCDAVKEKREAEFLAQMPPFEAFAPEYRKKISAEFTKARQILRAAEEVSSRRETCFDSVGMDENEKIRAELISVGIGKEKYAAMALCAAVRNFDGIIDYINNGKTIADLEQKKKTSLDDLSSAACFYKKGVPVYMAYMLANGLQKCVRGFTASRDKKAAIIWSGHITAILDILDEKPELKEGGGLEEKTLEEARRAAYFGVRIKKGAEAIERLAAADLGTSGPLSAKEKDMLLYDVVGMSMAMYNKDPSPSAGRIRSKTMSAVHQ